MTDTILSEVKGFGCPYEDFDEDFFSKILREYAISLLTLIVERYPQVVTCDPDAALSLLTHPQISNSSPYCCPEIAHNVTALKSLDPVSAARGIGQVLLNLSCSGIPGSWAIRSEQACRLHWGHFLLPQARAIEVQSNGRTAIVKASNSNTSQTFTLENLGGAQWSNEQLETIPTVATRDSSILLVTDSLLKEFDLPQPDFPVLKEITSAQFENVSACLNLLHENFPACGAWIERVLRYLCLVHSPPTAMHSGSFEGYFGFVLMTDRHDPIKLAEMLIHECSHQYLSILTRFTELTDDDGRLYYSPFVKKERPAHRILWAYHAFANVEFFYRACIRQGISVSHSRNSIEQLRPELDVVEQALVSDINFTAFGRGVMDSLLSYRSRI